MHDVGEGAGLLPCPFCGGPGRILWCLCHKTKKNTNTIDKIICRRCCVSIQPIGENAIETWNRRAPPENQEKKTVQLTMSPDKNNEGKRKHVRRKS